MKVIDKKIVLFSILFLYSLCCTGLYAQNYSIKNRWNTKLSLSFNRTNEFNDPFIVFDKITPHPLQARLNARTECNYGVLNWLELGGYIGYIRYKNFYYGWNGDKKKTFFAPTFGVNVNVHLLSFWAKNKDSRWELFLTAKYGGAYLVNHVEFWCVNFITLSNGTMQRYEMRFGPKRYRHEFGIGIGGGVYFKNVFGLYAEAMVGQYSYFPEAIDCKYTIRAGIEFKFYSKKHKKKLEPIEKDDIIFH
ncbi:MAG: hypothetical protein FWH36_03235 [Lentimicrobiaceae bacterium]|nr:hypothetical protein [Lentimicrobiaceae bacterium]